MSKKAIRPQSKRHLYLFDDDWEFLVSHFGPRGTVTTTGVSEIARAIIHNAVVKMRQAEIDRRDSRSASLNTNPPND